MSVVLAHAGHWYHVILYLLPVALVAGGLWLAGRRLPDEDELDDLDDGFDDEPDAAVPGPR
ncbi:MAG: hypothetical protein AB7G37_04985 [Solirubrobacteraceae bacterium]